jgi:large subunit ribosomal protein L35
MTKLKNHSSAKKRFKATGSGLKMRSSGRNHILSKHSTKKKRHARGTTNLEGANLKVINKLLEA